MVKKRFVSEIQPFNDFSFHLTKFEVKSERLMLTRIGFLERQNGSFKLSGMIQEITVTYFRNGVQLNFQNLFQQIEIFLGNCQSPVTLIG